MKKMSERRYDYREKKMKSYRIGFTLFVVGIIISVSFFFMLVMPTLQIFSPSNEYLYMIFWVFGVGVTFFGVIVYSLTALINGSQMLEEWLEKRERI